TPETSVVLKGTVSDTDAGQMVKLQAEVRALGTAFNNVATQESVLVASGTLASVPVAGLLAGASYHWQARTVDGRGAVSAWVASGGNAESAADFTVNVVNTPPTSPSVLGQFRADAATTIGVGGSTPETSVALKATVSDPDAG